MVKYNEPELDAAFAALADPTRRRIVECLSRGGRTVGEVAEPFAMSAPAVSKHLRVLESAGLLRRRRVGREHHLSLEPGPIRQVQEWIAFHRKFWEGSFDRLDHYLENED